MGFFGGPRLCQAQRSRKQIATDFLTRLGLVNALRLGQPRSDK